MDKKTIPTITNQIRKKIFLLVIVVICSSCSTQASIESHPTGIFERTYNQRAEINKQIGGIIIAALEEYHNVEGNYPESLMDLMPDYLPSIPTTWDEQQFYYELESSDGYWLQFFFDGVDSNRYCAYLRYLEGWDCGRIYSGTLYN